jgi:hypothetical protein
MLAPLPFRAPDLEGSPMALISARMQFNTPRRLTSRTKSQSGLVMSSMFATPTVGWLALKCQDIRSEMCDRI